MNYALKFGEMNYLNIKPKIIIEKYIEVLSQKYPTDYKFWCFNGIVEFIQVFERNDFGFKRYCFDRNFNKCNYFSEEGQEYNKFDKPINLERMIHFSEVISAPFSYARVDLYNVKGKIIFGEITLTPTAGNNYFLTNKAQIKLSELFTIN